MRSACPPRTTSTTRRSKTATCSTPASLQLPADFWDKHGKTVESWQQGGLTLLPDRRRRLVGSLLINQFVYLEAPGAPPLYAKVIEITGKTAVLRTLKDYTHQKNSIWGIDGAQPRPELRASTC